MKKIFKAHSKLGPRLTETKRHHYKPLDEEQKSNRPHHILSFTLEDPVFAAEVNRKLINAQQEHRNFYFRYIETITKHVFQIQTKDINEKDLKKILFMVGLKANAGIKKR